MSTGTSLVVGACQADPPMAMDGAVHPSAIHHPSSAIRHPSSAIHHPSRPTLLLVDFRGQVIHHSQPVSFPFVAHLNWTVLAHMQ